MATRYHNALVAAFSLLAILTPIIAANLRDDNASGLFDGESQTKGRGMNTTPRRLQFNDDDDDDIPRCSNGILGIESSHGQVCCAAGCGQCGGVGCSRFGLPEHDAFDCCVTEIVDFGMSCSEKGSAPCFINDLRRCTNGVDGVGSADGTVCCEAGCDECSEDACSDGGTESVCCSSEIASSGDFCDSTGGVAPCIITEVASTCSNGIIGIESSNGDVCCLAACGQCGGVGCSTIGRPNFDAYDCCVTEIEDFGMPCSQTGSAPCYIDGDTTGTIRDDMPTPMPAVVSPEIDSLCSNGITGIESSNGDVCCVAACGQCGGEGCSTIGLPEFDAFDCCVTEIEDFGMPCSQTGSAPCYIDGDTTVTIRDDVPTPMPAVVSPEIDSLCSNGITGIESSNGDVCCVAACGQCGGEGCSTIGLPDFDAFDCCVTEIEDFGMPCSQRGSAPCYIDGDTTVTIRDDVPTPMPAVVSPEIDSLCSNGITGIESSNGDVCCVAACGQCGGEGCSTIGLPDFDAFDCCVTEIEDFGMPCSQTGSAPCYIDGDTTGTIRDDVPTPMPAVVSPPTETVVSTPMPMGAIIDDVSTPTPIGVSPPTETVVSTPMPMGAIIDDVPTPTPIGVSPPTETVVSTTMPMGAIIDVSTPTPNIVSPPMETVVSTLVPMGTAIDVSTPTPNIVSPPMETVVSTLMPMGTAIDVPTPTPTIVSPPMEIVVSTPMPMETAIDLPTPTPMGVSPPMETVFSTPMPMGTAIDGPTPTPIVVSSPIQTVSFTMTPTAITTETDSFCSNGVPGIESSNGQACCVAECGQCGGVGCSTVGLPDLGPEACCATEIIDFGMSCSEAASAPCAIDDEEFELCSNGVVGLESADGTVCCVSSCNECSEDACSLSFDFESDSGCCSSEIFGFGDLCDVTNEAPCVISEAGTSSPTEPSAEITSVCSNGYTGIESSDGQVCCVAECGQCGGVGCSTVGLPDLGPEACCATEIIDFGMSCSEAASAPCAIDDEEFELCSNGVVGLESADGTVCCVSSCNECSEDACSLSFDFESDSGCCSSEIFGFGDLCDVTNEAPCVISEAGTSSPTEPSAEITSVCSNGYTGIESSDGQVCCVAECGQCGGVGCSTVGLPDLGPEACCATEIIDFGMSCSEAASAPCAIDDEEFELCSNGVVGLESADGTVCCVSSCNECSEDACSLSFDFESDSGCCSSEIFGFGDLCDVTNEAPCVISEAGTSSPTEPSAEITSVCSNGYTGIESSDGQVCCVAECGQCGGVGCSTVGLPDLGPEACCATEIIDFGMSCSEAASAPCAIDDEEFELCSNGVVGLESADGTVCCVSSCNECSEDACSLSFDFESDSGCCSSEIFGFGDLCDVTNEAPCVISEAGTSSPTEPSAEITSVCSNGYTGIESSDGQVCCVAECGQCGGVGCSTVGLPDLGPEACCATEIIDFGMSCSEAASAPCAIDDEEFELCSNGVVGLESADGTVCCVSSCNECSEDACSLSFDFESDSGCCSSEIFGFGDLCDVTNEAPCVISEAGTSSPTEPSAEITSVCSNGYTGIESSDGQVCCVAECGQCGGVGCSTVGLPDLGPEACCATEIIDFGMSCSEAASAPCAIDDEEFELCSNGVVGLESADGTVCCVSSCNECSEDACSLSFDFESDSGCCSSEIFGFGDLCDVTNEAPCVISEAVTTTSTELSPELVSVCSNGYSGIESSNGLACCAAECGQCGGVGCSTVGQPDLGPEDCCETEIVNLGVSCEEIGSAPCYLEGISMPSDMPTTAPVNVADVSTAAPFGTSAPTSPAVGIGFVCSNGYPGVESSNGLVCCVAACGQCGGAGCSTVGQPDLGADDCCSTEILDFGISCTETDSAPCHLQQAIIASADTPTPAPVFTYTQFPIEVLSSDLPTCIDTFTFEGCYEEEIEDPFFSKLGDANMTPELCFSTCSGEDALYMGLIGGNECACGNDDSYLSSNKTEGSCTSACQGDAGQTCGGPLAFDFYTISTVCS